MAILVKVDELITDGANGEDLALSNDVSSVALASNGGNGSGYTIYDIYAEDFSVIYGEWNTGTAPSGVAFSPDNYLVATSNDEYLTLFNKISHVELAKIKIPTCDASKLSKVRFSGGGKLAFIKQTCSTNYATVKFY